MAKSGLHTGFYHSASIAPLTGVPLHFPRSVPGPANCAHVLAVLRARYWGKKGRSPRAGCNQYGGIDERCYETHSVICNVIDEVLLFVSQPLTRLRRYILALPTELHHDQVVMAGFEPATKGSLSNGIAVGVFMKLWGREAKEQSRDTV